ncbi:MULTISPECIES: PEP-CTERM sorting domain-containing protein [Vibrio]|uniref:PEP-CTERM sorting domain-containing protein n=2 Tax=Vibrio TaxID=662 RepID=A0A7X4LQ82_9VIBR|nr:MULTISPECIES: PEP-CTERM sorting domain-containing protein [Vibrio]MBF9002167.1 PEP-CTERM sorting domain-containing protein [Vibrio nitrifigilis]MZI96004.1 PEP-CTERM sorting domain-containing protein [Vibrio eleionomae]
MKRKLYQCCLVTFLLLLSQTASAATINLSSTTELVVSKGLEWLDWESIIGKSVDDTLTLVQQNDYSYLLTDTSDISELISSGISLLESRYTWSGGSYDVEQFNLVKSAVTELLSILGISYDDGLDDVIKNEITYASISSSSYLQALAQSWLTDVVEEYNETSSLQETVSYAVATASDYIASQTPVPEPSTLLIFLVAALLLVSNRRRIRSSFSIRYAM